MLYRAMGLSLPAALLSADVIMSLLYTRDLVDLDTDPMSDPDTAVLAGRLDVTEAELEALIDSPALTEWRDAITEFFEGKRVNFEDLEPLA